MKTLSIAAVLVMCSTAPSLSGEALRVSDVFPAEGQGGGVFTIKYLDRPGGTLQEAQLDEVRVSNDRVVASGHGYRVEYAVRSRGAYLVFRIKQVAEPVPGTLMHLAFRLGSDPLVLTRLDYMSVPRDGGRTMTWPWIWAGETPNPLGAFALHAPPSDAAFDENLLSMWVHDGLPHPRVEGAWTLEKARTWLAEWQERFSDQSCLVVGAKSRAELDNVTAWAGNIGMKRIYLHTDTWRGEYWPVHHSYLRVNPEVFPRGEEDLNAYTSGLREKGMSFAVHSTVMSIARHDPDYVKSGVHPGLARWVRGSLEKAAGAQDGTLYFRPVPGAKYPRVVGHEGYGPDTMRPWMNVRLFRVGNELVDVGLVEHTDREVWVLKRCRRGDWGTQAAAHPAGTVTEGMTRGYGQAFVPDSDAPLFEETIRRWADFCTRNHVDHLECDALEIHADRPWGPAKFSWLLTSHLALPSTSNTSSGRPLPFHIEYWFRSSSRVLANHARGGVAGGASLPLYLHSDTRMATGPYEILFKPAQMVGRGGDSFNISYPWPMFGVTPEILEHHGMVPVVEQLVRDWRTALQDITPGQREAMARTFGPFRGAAGRGNQLATDVLFRPEVVHGTSRIVPLRLVGRTDGELNWGFGQEFGPVVPRQYLRAGESLELTNTMPAQEPEFVVRVLGGLAESAEATEEPPGPTGNADILLDAYATGTTTDHAVHPLHTARHIWPADAMDQGEAKAGPAEIRHVFTVTHPAPVKRARLFLQVDDEAVVYVNGTKVFHGGRYDQAHFVEIRNLRPGQNDVTIKAANAGGPGGVAAALHVEQGDATRILASDGSWRGRPVGGAWGAVVELAAYGEGGWPRAQPRLGALRPDLMPGTAAIEPAAGHVADLQGDTLRMVCRNDGPGPAVHIDDRPAWASSLDMSEARGLGCTVTGDGSGAVLVFTVEGRGQRDYAIPIDFTGAREIQIPSGEVAWGDPKWGWRFHAARFDYSRIRKVRAGFGVVPANTEVKVTVTNLRPLREVASGLRDFTVRLGPERELVVPGPVESGHYLWYRGGNTVGLHDLNWNKVAELPVRKRDFLFPAGRFTAELSGTPVGESPWLEVQFFAKGAPLRH